jgi:hypothetical protein
MLILDIATSAQKSDALLDCSFVAPVAKKKDRKEKPAKKSRQTKSRQLVTGG